jgi:hypothetical protein
MTDFARSHPGQTHQPAPSIHRYRPHSRRLHTQVWSLLVQSARVARNALLDLRFGGLLIGTEESRFRDQGAVRTENTDYGALPAIFAGRIQPDDVLVDVGCGRGRVINWWLARGLTNRLVGIELDPSIAARTARRLRRFPQVRILAGDAVAQLPSEATLLYLYNPFGAETLGRLKARLEELGADHEVRVLYYRPVHLGVFEQDSAWQIERISVGGSAALPYDECVCLIMRRQASTSPLAAAPADAA